MAKMASWTTEETTKYVESGGVEEPLDPSAPAKQQTFWETTGIDPFDKLPDEVKWKTSTGVAVITLNRPEVRRRLPPCAASARSAH